VPIFLLLTGALEIYGIQKTLFEAVIERSSDGSITRFARCKLWFLLPQVSKTLVQVLIVIITFLCAKLYELLLFGFDPWQIRCFDASSTTLNSVDWGKSCREYYCVRQISITLPIRLFFESPSDRTCILIIT
jgi:hypothetical protein